MWDIVGAKVKKDVDQGSLFGDEDLPPKRKPQTLANPDLLITVPDPVEEEVANFLDDLKDLELSEGDYPNWQAVMEKFEYGVDTEISKVEYASVLGVKPGGEGFLEILQPPRNEGKKVAPTEKTQEELIEQLKSSVRDLGADLLADAGIGSHELGYFYSVLIAHVRQKLLNNQTLVAVSKETMLHAIRQRYHMSNHFRQVPGLVASIVKYKKEVTNGGN